MDLDRALAISFLFHLTVFGLVLIPWKERPAIQHITSVELIHLQPSRQKPRRERKRGAKKEIEKEPEIEKPTLAKKPPSQPEGNDNEDAPAIKGGNTSDPALVAVANYAQELQGFIERNRFYPRRALMMEQTGTVKVRLTINPDGSFASVEILEGSDYDILDQAAEDLVTQLKSFKPLPKTYQGSGTFIVPINYQLRDQSI